MPFLAACATHAEGGVGRGPRLRAAVLSSCTVVCCAGVLFFLLPLLFCRCCLSLCLSVCRSVLCTVAALPVVLPLLPALLPPLLLLLLSVCFVLVCCSLRRRSSAAVVLVSPSRRPTRLAQDGSDSEAAGRASVGFGGVVVRCRRCLPRHAGECDGAPRRPQRLTSPRDRAVGHVPPAFRLQDVRRTEIAPPQSTRSPAEARRHLTPWDHCAPTSSKTAR
jgi:hypothetical protein